MTRVFLDSNVFLYASGTESPYREPCRELLRAVGEGTLIAETSVEVIQETIHVRVRRTRRREDARTLADGIARACTVHPFEPTDLERAVDLFTADEALSMRDAVHAAVALERGLTVLVSADADFDRVAGLGRIDPLDPKATAVLVARDA